LNVCTCQRRFTTLNKHNLWHSSNTKTGFP
jgi:hypothetical protein